MDEIAAQFTGRGFGIVMVINQHDGARYRISTVKRATPKRVELFQGPELLTSITGPSFYDTAIFPIGLFGKPRLFHAALRRFFVLPEELAMKFHLYMVKVVQLKERSGWSEAAQHGIDRALAELRMNEAE